MSSFVTWPFIQNYENLPKLLREQLSKFGLEFSKDDKVKLEVSRLLSQSRKQLEKLPSRDRKYIIRAAYEYALLKVKPVMKMLRTSYFSTLRCYTLNGSETIELKNIIQRGEHVRVMEGKSYPSGTTVVVKWYESGKKNVMSEIQAYKRMKELGATVPNFSSGFQLWNRPVLVMEKLYPIGPNDDEFEMARQVLPQLQILHRFAVHNDLKPGNVMKNSRGDYLVIDYGGIATTKFQHGFRRAIWSPYWCSQISRGRDQITTAKNDFIELGYTMKTLQNHRVGIMGRIRLGQKGNDPIRTGFTGKLRLYMDYVEQINERNILPQDYQNIMNILNS